MDLLEIGKLQRGLKTGNGAHALFLISILSWPKNKKSFQIVERIFFLFQMNIYTVFHLLYAIAYFRVTGFCKPILLSLFHIYDFIYDIGRISSPGKNAMIFFVMQIKRFTVVHFEFFENSFVFNREFEFITR